MHSTFHTIVNMVNWTTKIVKPGSNWIFFTKKWQTRTVLEFSASPWNTNHNPNVQNFCSSKKLHNPSCPWVLKAAVSYLCDLTLKFGRQKNKSRSVELIIQVFGSSTLNYSSWMRSPWQSSNPSTVTVRQLLTELEHRQRGSNLFSDRKILSVVFNYLKKEKEQECEEETPLPLQKGKQPVLKT